MAFVPSDNVAGNHRAVAARIINDRGIQLDDGDYDLDEPLPPLQAGTCISGAPGMRTRILCNYTVSSPDFNGIFTIANTCPGGGGTCSDPAIADITIRDLEIWVPGLDPDVTPTQSRIDQFPWAIWGGYDTSRIRIENVRIANVPRGIRLHSGGNIIRDITGMPAYIGIEMDCAGSAMVVENVAFNAYWGGDSGEGPVSAIDQWMRENGTGIVCRRIDTLKMSDIQIPNRLIGLLFDQANAAYDNSYWGGGTGGDLKHIACDNCTNGIKVVGLRPDSTKPDWQSPNDWPGLGGIVIDGYNWSGPSGESYALIVNSPRTSGGALWPERESEVCVVNGRFANGATNHCIYVPSGRLQLINPKVLLTGGLCAIESGELQIIGGRVPSAYTGSVNLAAGCRAAIIKGVKGLAGGSQIVNNMTPGTYEIANNLPV